MSNKQIYILDLETSSEQGKNIMDAVILELAIIQLDLSTYKYQTVYDKTIQQPVEKIQNAWILQEGYLTLKDIANGLSLNMTKVAVQDILEDQQWTSFNTAFDYAFLKQWALDINPPAYCIMLRTKPITQIKQYYRADWKWPKLTEAYAYLYNKEMTETHRAEADAISATKVLIKLLQLDQNIAKLKPLLSTDYNTKPSQRKITQITYQDKNGFTSTRQITPIQFYRNGTIIEAYDHEKRETCKYNLTRIQQIMSNSNEPE